MLYHDTDPQRQMARERAEQLAQEMRRVSDPLPVDRGDHRRSRRIAELLLAARRGERPRTHRAHAYDA
jgi:hypothetical protein